MTVAATVRVAVVVVDGVARLRSVCKVDFDPNQEAQMINNQ